jgi:hypothetical protein
MIGGLAMKKTSNQEEIAGSFRSELKEHFNEKKLRALNQAMDAVVKQISNISGKPIELVEQNIKRLEIRGDRDSGGHYNDGLVIYKEKAQQHGEDSIFGPHDCHIRFTVCNPLPWGPQVCVEIELPWPCPDVVFEPGPFE